MRYCILKFVIILLAIIPLNSSAQNKDVFWSETTAAIKNFIENKPRKAILHATRARLRRNDPRLDLFIALVALQQKERKLASKELKRIIETQSPYALSYYWAARVAWTQGQTRLAKKHIAKAYTLGSHLPAIQIAFFMLMPIRQGQGALQKLINTPKLIYDPALFPSPKHSAIDLYEDMLSDFPHKTALNKTIGHLLYQIGAIYNAQRYFTKVLIDDKNDVDAYAMKGFCALALGQIKESQILAKQALARDPNRALSNALMGEILKRNNKTQLAQKHLRKAVDAKPKDDVLLTQLASVCLTNENLECAKRFYLSALRQSPTLADAHFGIAKVAITKNHYQQALLALNRAIALDPCQSNYYLALSALPKMRNQKYRLRTISKKIGTIRNRFTKKKKNALANYDAFLNFKKNCLDKKQGRDKNCRSKISSLSTPQALLLQLYLKRNEKHLSVLLASRLKNRLIHANPLARNYKQLLKLLVISGKKQSIVEPLALLYF